MASHTLVDCVPVGGIEFQMSHLNLQRLGYIYVWENV